MLDAERCILCSRCVRFCDEVTRHRRARHLQPRRPLRDRARSRARRSRTSYSGNVIDICPVGALTDRDFRFQVRVWYLDTAKSRLHRAAPAAATSRSARAGGGRTTTRAGAWLGSKPRLQRRRQPLVDLRRGPVRLRLDRRRHAARSRAGAARGDRAASDDVGRRHRRAAAGARALPARRRSACSPRRRCRTRILFALGGCPRHLGRSSRAISGCRRARAGDEDDLLIRADKNPNTPRRRALRADAGRGRARRAGMPRGRARRSGSRCSGSSATTCFESGLPRGRRSTTALAARSTAWSSRDRPRTRRARAAHLVLPSAAYVERDGTFTNFQGRVQRFRAAVAAAPAEALPDWEILGAPRVGLSALAGRSAQPAAREQVFTALRPGDARHSQGADVPRASDDRLAGAA